MSVEGGEGAVEVPQMRKILCLILFNSQSFCHFAKKRNKIKKKGINFILMLAAFCLGFAKGCQICRQSAAAALSAMQMVARATW